MLGQPRSLGTLVFIVVEGTADAKAREAGVGVGDGLFASPCGTQAPSVLLHVRIPTSLPNSAKSELGLACGAFTRAAHLKLSKAVCGVHVGTDIWVQ